MKGVCSIRWGRRMALLVGLVAVTPAVAADLEAWFTLIESDPAARARAYQAGKERATLCTYCHGADGNSVKPDVPNLAGQNPLYLWRQIDNFATGRRENFVMQALAKDFSDEDKVNLAVYFAANTPRTEPLDPDRGDRGRQLYQQHCATCHGTDARGTRDYARLAGQRREYLIATLTGFRDNTGAAAKRRSNVMVAQVKGLSDENIRDLAAYLSALE